MPASAVTTRLLSSTSMIRSMRVRSMEFPIQSEGPALGAGTPPAVNWDPMVAGYAQYTGDFLGRGGTNHHVGNRSCIPWSL